jgi:uncharacterized protein YndB with AHSA1/START domain
MSRTDVAERVIATTPHRVYEAFVDPQLLSAWLPPAGMTAHFERFDLRPGGGYRLILTYNDATSAPGKATADTDIVDARFVEIVPDRRLTHAVDFESDDPAFAGTMMMTWSVVAVADGSRVEFRADNVPDGISADDHAAGLNASLDQLAALLEQ